jgi:hypothetical protein
MMETAVKRRPTRTVGISRRAAAAVVVVAVFGLFFGSSVFPRYFAGTIGITSASILLAVVLFAVALRCGADAFHPARLLAVLLALGFVLGPIVHAATGRYILPDGAARQSAQLPRAEWIVLAGAVLSLLAMRAVLRCYWRTELRPTRRDPISDRGLAAAVVVALVGTALLATYFALSGSSSVSLEGRGGSYAVVPHEGRRAYLSLLAPLGLGGLLVIFACALERRSRLGIVGAAVAATIYGAALALPGSRANFLYAIAPLWLVFVIYRRIPRRLWIVIIALGLLVTLFYAGSLRSAETRSEFADNPWSTLVENRPRVSRGEDFFLLDLAHTEPFLAINDAYPATRPFLGGESLALGFTGPAGWKFAKEIGLQIDPPAGVTATATAYGRDPSTFGAGLTATLPGELYANLGVPGVVLGLCIFGAVAGAIRRRALLHTASGSLVVYAVQITILFAIFADYSGQFYRTGAVLFGAIVALVAGGERKFALGRATAVALVIAGSAGACFVMLRFAGVPSASVLVSMVPAYLALAGVVAFLALRLGRPLVRPRRMSRSA